MVSAYWIRRQVFGSPRIPRTEPRCVRVYRGLNFRKYPHTADVCRYLDTLSVPRRIPHTYAVSADFWSKNRRPAPWRPLRGARAHAQHVYRRPLRGAGVYIYTPPSRSMVYAVCALLPTFPLHALPSSAPLDSARAAASGCAHCLCKLPCNPGVGGGGAHPAHRRRPAGPG